MTQQLTAAQLVTTGGDWICFACHSAITQTDNANVVWTYNGGWESNVSIRLVHKHCDPVDDWSSHEARALVGLRGVARAIRMSVKATQGGVDADWLWKGALLRVNVREYEETHGSEPDVGV